MGVESRDLNRTTGGVGMDEPQDDILGQLQDYGLKARLTSLEHVGSMGDELLSLMNQGLIGEEFGRINLDRMGFDHTTIMPKARSILVVASPQSMTRLYFEYQGEMHCITLPPTYVHRELHEKVKKALNAVLPQHGYDYKGVRLPLKMLAASTGLGMYGRNNICYVQGMGSFFGLCAFYADIPCTSDSWTDKAMMPECAGCSECIEACPTGSISAARSVIDASKCLTYFNEREDSFPVWVKPHWHNAIIGCMRCQLACPQNEGFLDKVEHEVTFDAAETSILLEGKSLPELPDPLREKLDQLSLVDCYSVLSRNLSSLLNGRSCGFGSD